MKDKLLEHVRIKWVDNYDDNEPVNGMAEYNGIFYHFVWIDEWSGKKIYKLVEYSEDELKQEIDWQIFYCKQVSPNAGMTNNANKVIYFSEESQKIFFDAYDAWEQPNYMQRDAIGYFSL